MSVVHSRKYTWPQPDSPAAELRSGNGTRRRLGIPSRWVSARPYADAIYSQPRIPFNLEKQGEKSTSQELMLSFAHSLGYASARVFKAKGATDPAFGPFLAKHTEFRKL